MKQKSALLIAACFCQLIAAPSNDTLTKGNDTLVIGQYGEVFERNGRIAIGERPDLHQCGITVKLMSETAPSTNIAALSLPFCGISWISLSDSGSFIISCLDSGQEEGQCIAQCFSATGNRLWDRLYIDLPDQSRLTQCLLSPNGKYAIMSTADTCVLFSGKTGERIPSLLENKVAGQYTAFFDDSSFVNIIQQNWLVLKFDPAKDSLLLEKKIADPSNGKFELCLNRFRPNSQIISSNNSIALRLVTPLPRISRDSAKNLTPQQRLDRIEMITRKHALLILTKDFCPKDYLDMNGRLNRFDFFDDAIIADVDSKNAAGKHEGATKLYIAGQRVPVFISNRAISKVVKSNGETHLKLYGTENLLKYNKAKHEFSDAATDVIAINKANKKLFVKLSK